jgi:hypothetical protein
MWSCRVLAGSATALWRSRRARTIAQRTDWPRGFESGPPQKAAPKTPERAVASRLLKWELNCLFRFAERFFQDANREVGLLFVNDERWRDADGVFAGIEGQQALVERADNHFVT